jgi:DNA-binding transcriptional ArsR family regulator
MTEKFDNYDVQARDLIMRATTQQPPTEIFKALSDPIRWDIVLQMASVDELACVALEDTLPVSKPTISYHIKTLYQAGLINVRKSGRNYFYSLRREVLHRLLDDLRELAPASDEDELAPSGPAGERPGTPEHAEEVVVPTW